MKRWAVIENAGYEGEYVLCDNLTSHDEAWRYARGKYTKDELDPHHPNCLHVDVAFWDEETAGWSYDY